MFFLLDIGQTGNFFLSAIDMPAMTPLRVTVRLAISLLWLLRLVHHGPLPAELCGLSLAELDELTDASCIPYSFLPSVFPSHNSFHGCGNNQIVLAEVVCVCQLLRNVKTVARVGSFYVVAPAGTSRTWWPTRIFPGFACHYLMCGKPWWSSFGQQRFRPWMTCFRDGLQWPHQWKSVSSAHFPASGLRSLCGAQAGQPSFEEGGRSRRHLLPQDASCWIFYLAIFSSVRWPFGVVERDTKQVNLYNLGCLKRHIVTFIFGKHMLVSGFHSHIRFFRLSHKWLCQRCFLLVA